MPSVRTLLLCLLLWAPLAGGHPHAWIDIEIELHFDADGNFTAISQRWTFDPLYSLVLIEDLVGSRRDLEAEQALRVAADEIVANMAGHHYMTELHHAERRLTALSVSDHGLRMSRDRRLVLGLTLQLDEAIDLRAAPLHYAVYDPTYYIELLHTEGHSPNLINAPDGCRINIRRPRPDPALVARAAALDVNQTGDPDLGRHFAERAEVRCEP